MPSCSIPDCGKPQKARGWCVAHYTRHRRHGDPLAGRTQPGEPERFLREVIMAYEGDECLPWPFTRNPQGRGQIWDGAKLQLVPRMVCDRVNGPPPTPDHEAAHSCGKGHLGCVTKGHLSWKTSAGNKADQLIHGTRIRGERQWMAKLTETDVREIRSLLGTMPKQRIATMFGVSPDNIRAIEIGRSWAWLSEREAA